MPRGNSVIPKARSNSQDVPTVEIISCVRETMGATEVCPLTKFTVRCTFLTVREPYAPYHAMP